MIKIPIIVGKNRLRGNSVGAMVDDDFGENNLFRLRGILREEAIAAQVEPTEDWLTTAVCQLLRMFDAANAQWQADKKDSIGHVFEAALPSGKSILMGDRRMLARLNPPPAMPPPSTQSITGG